MADRIILGIDPGLANTGWGLVCQRGSKLSCLAYGCISTPKESELSQRLKKIHDQMAAVIARFEPTCVGIETVWFGENTQSAFATGQARGAALVACAGGNLEVAEFSPSQIKLAVVGEGSASKDQVQYMVKQLLALDALPKPDHAADALAAAICFTTHEGLAARVKQAKAATAFGSKSTSTPRSETGSAPAAKSDFNIAVSADRIRKEAL